MVKGTNRQVASGKWQGTLVSGLGYGTKYVRVRVRVRARVSGLHTVAYDRLCNEAMEAANLRGDWPVLLVFAWFSVCVCSSS